MVLFVGLGNIGARYENTRHNAGFMLADLLLECIKSGDFPPKNAADLAALLTHRAAKITAQNSANLPPHLAQILTQNLAQTTPQTSPQPTTKTPQNPPPNHQHSNRPNSNLKRQTATASANFLSSLDVAQFFRARPQLTDVGGAKFYGELYKFGELLVLKPATFMNASGKSVRAVAEFYKPARIVVAHDDIDLPLAALRFKKGGSSGGHNGIKSIDAAISPNYERLRLGVGAAKSAARNGAVGAGNAGQNLAQNAAQNADTNLAQNAAKTGANSNLAQNRAAHAPNTIDFVLGEFSAFEIAALQSALNHALLALCAVLCGLPTADIASRFSLKGI